MIFEGPKKPEILPQKISPEQPAHQEQELSLEEQFAALQVELAQERKEKAEMGERLEKTEEENEALKEENTELKEENVEIKENFEKSEEEKAELKKENEALKRLNEILETENGELGERLELFKAALIEEKKEANTGLRKRTDFFKNLEKTIIETTTANLGDDFMREFKAVKNSDELMPMLNKMEDALIDSDVYVVASDVSFLSLANDESHEAGDELLGALGDSARKVGSPEITDEMIEASLEGQPEAIIFELYRTGGDEFGGIVKAQSHKEIASKLQTLQDNFSNKNIDILESKGLKPNIDVGYVHVSEVVQVYKQFIKEKEAMGLGNDLNDTMHHMLNLANGIADRRATVEKGITRINLLMELRTERPDVYDDVISFLRKGALNISDDALDILIGVSKGAENKEEWDRSLLEAIRDLADKEVKRSEEAKQLEIRIVRKVADSIFFPEGMSDINGNGEK